MVVNLPPAFRFIFFDDLNECGCDEEDVSFDDNLARILVPVLYLEAGEGRGITGYYTNSLTAGTDLSRYLVSIPD